MMVLTAMEDVSVTMVGKDLFAIPVSSYFRNICDKTKLGELAILCCK